MADRGNYEVLWADNALPEDFGDADTYVPTNPAYPEQSPNQYSVGWFVSPNTVVKQPHQWLNAWAQSVDWQIYNAMSESGEWMPEFNYTVGAVVYVGELKFRALVANQNVNPVGNPTTWAPTKFYTWDETHADFLALKAKADGHIDAVMDPHGTTWANFVNGVGASKSAIDNAIAAQNAVALAHIQATNNPHGLTPEQIDCLHVVRGGNYTGTISMLRMDLPGSSGIRRLSQGMEFFATGLRLGIDTAKSCAQKNGKAMLTDNNLHDLRIRNNNKFDVPVPDIHLALLDGLNAYAAPIGTVIEYTADAGIEYTDRNGVVRIAGQDELPLGVEGLALRPGFNQRLTVTGLKKGEGTASAIVDGLQLVNTIDYQDENLLSYLPNAVSVRDLRAWDVVLTRYQASHLGYLP